jgi:hypothetical protein
VRVAQGFVLALFLGGCSCGKERVTEHQPASSPAPAPAPAPGAVRITNVRFDSTGDDVLVGVSVENGAEVPVFIITDDGRVAYRAEENLLELNLVEQRISDEFCHYAAPAQKQLPPHSAETIELRLRRTLPRNVPSEGGPPVVLYDPIHQSKEVRVAIAWSDVRLEPDPHLWSKCTEEMSANVSAKQRGIATGIWKAS